MDVAEPPRIVLESPEACADAPRLEGLLRGALARARAPGDAWSVDVKIERTDDAHELRARAGITDAGGVQVARRVLSNHAADCEGLARAVGVWASLVLEAQLAREHSARDDAAEPDAQRDGPREAGAMDAGGEEKSASRDGDDEPTQAVTKPEIRLAGPTPEDSSSPESDGAPANDRLSTLEVGSGAFVMALGSAALGGLSMHAALGRAPGPFLRPAIFVGETWTPTWMSDSKTYLNSTWTAARVDACLRLPLSNEPRQGFALDPCLGGEVGSRQAGGTTTTGVSFGPAIDLRKQLGNGIAATLRGVAGIDVAGTYPRVADRLSARLEVALSSGIW